MVEAERRAGRKGGEQERAAAESYLEGAPSPPAASAQQGPRVRVTVRQRLASWKNTAMLPDVGARSFCLLRLPEVRALAEVQGEPGPRVHGGRSPPFL